MSNFVFMTKFLHLFVAKRFTVISYDHINNPEVLDNLVKDKESNSIPIGLF